MEPENEYASEFSELRVYMREAVEHGFIVPAEDNDLIQPEARTDYAQLSEYIYEDYGLDGQYMILTDEWRAAIRKLRGE